MNEPAFIVATGIPLYLHYSGYVYSFIKTQYFFPLFVSLLLFFSFNEILTRFMSTAVHINYIQLFFSTALIVLLIIPKCTRVYRMKTIMKLVVDP